MRDCVQGLAATIAGARGAGICRACELRLYPRALANLVGVGWPIHETLLAGLSDVPDKYKKQLATASPLRCRDQHFRHHDAGIAPLARRLISSLFGVALTNGLPFASLEGVANPLIAAGRAAAGQRRRTEARRRRARARRRGADRRDVIGVGAGGTQLAIEAGAVTAGERYRGMRGCRESSDHKKQASVHFRNLWLSVSLLSSSNPTDPDRLLPATLRP